MKYDITLDDPGDSIWHILGLLLPILLVIRALLYYIDDHRRSR